MLRILFLVCVLAYSVYAVVQHQMTTTCCRNNCPRGFQWHENKCYSVASCKMTWNKANDYCYSREAYMPAIKSQSDFNFLEWLIPSEKDGVASVWLQSSGRGPINDGEHNLSIHRYKWVDGSFVDMDWFPHVVYNATPCNGSADDPCRLAILKNVLGGWAIGTHSQESQSFYAVCVIKEPKSRPYEPQQDIRNDDEVAAANNLKPVTSPNTSPSYRCNATANLTPVPDREPPAVRNTIQTNVTRQPEILLTITPSRLLVPLEQQFQAFQDSDFSQVYDNTTESL